MKYHEIPVGRQGVVDNPTLQIQYEDSGGKHCLEISGASSDRFAVFEETDRILVLVKNRRFCYAYLEIYERFQKVGQISVEGRKQVTRCLGKKGLGLSSLELVKRLRESIRECGDESSALRAPDLTPPVAGSLPSPATTHRRSSAARAADSPRVARPRRTPKGMRAT